MCEKINPTMLLVTAEFADRESFKMIPVHKECPYSEAIYVMNEKVLYLMSAQSKESMHLVPRLDEDGELQRAKKPKQNGLLYKEQRVMVDTFVEHPVSVKEEVVNIIKMFAVNEKEFDYMKYLDQPAKLVDTVPGSAMPENKETTKSEINKPSKKGGTK